ncbi:MAG: EAL domain-containing protein [Anaerolineae bacterium]|nr:EAL domain-containing protein [Anaerolineae bacterium]
MRKKAVVRLELENDLRNALERGEFVLNYQPIIEIDTNRLAGFEALIRWQHPQRGVILPMVFVPIAEETNLIVTIGKWVLQQACLQMCDWLVKYPQMKDVVMHVNVSARQFNQPNLYQMVEHVLSKTGLPPSNLALEVTESVLIENYDPAVALLHTLRRVGVQLEIDDFGTGYSSLTHLRCLPVNVLKIDRSFVSRMCVSGDSSAEIVRAIIALAKEMGKKVIAEGVETPEELHKLKELGCGYAQGFLISAAVGSLEAEKLIKSWQGAMNT